MKKILLIINLSLASLFASCQNNTTKVIINPQKADPMSDKINKTEEEWKKTLSPEQYNILREKGTEAPYSGKYNMHFEKGKYVCAACGYELFESGNKFESHCGWPSFDDEIAGGRITKKTDYTHGMVRTEIMCGKCGGHLGHIFDDGPTSTGKRYCVNSLSIDFKEEKK
ncbi:MAG: peptide-methionine (R)-S-oxide reductase MsrB [Bacteroidia bacterium]